MNFLKKLFFSSPAQQSKTVQPHGLQDSSDQIPLEILMQMFEKSARYVAQSSTPISDQNKLIIYGLYKQATIGDCNTAKPSMLDLVGKSKWNAWNNFLGMPKVQAMKMYISKAVEFAPEIQGKIESDFQGNESEAKQTGVKKSGSSAAQGTVGLKMVEQKDYSDSYSHPYFKSIEKGLPLEKGSLNRQLLLQKNNSPACYPLHFAIDKQRIEMVKQFLQLLQVSDIEGMQDEEGTGIKEYAELIENEQIMVLVEKKLKKN